MPTFGSTLLSFIPEWTADGGRYAIEKCAEYGFDMLEINLPGSMNIDTKTVKKQLADKGLIGRYSLCIPKEYHVPFYPEKATIYLKSVLDKVSEMGADFLGGVLHSSIATFTGAPATPAERQIVKEVFTEVAKYAKNNGISLALEPINRYESYVFTSAGEVLDLINEIGVNNIGLHLDTFHMNIEEVNFYTPVVEAGANLTHVHMTESDRGMLGEGNVHWDDFFRALAEINYQGPLVLENFSSEIKELIGPTSLWRPSKYNSEDLAKGSLVFMKEMVNKYYR